MSSASGSSSCCGVRGLVAERDILPGDCILSLPSTCIISFDTAMASDLVRACGPGACTGPWCVHVALVRVCVLVSSLDMGGYWVQPMVHEVAMCPM